jgi:hypothetical protein
VNILQGLLFTVSCRQTDYRTHNSHGQLSAETDSYHPSPKIKPLFQGAHSYLQLPATLLSCDAQEAAVERQKHWLEKLAAYADDQKE